MRKFLYTLLTPILGLSICGLALSSCQQKEEEGQTAEQFINENIDFAEQQISKQLELIHETGEILYPRTLKDGKISYVPIQDWTSGFFPGTLWEMYRLTKDEKWAEEAKQFTEGLDSVKYLKWHHDVGFMIGCSYLKGYRLKQIPEYKDVIIEAARSLSTRYRPDARVIQSWDADRGWQAERGWKCPVIIDNMMNLELLFEATKLSGDSTFYNIAVNHANTTLENHFRPDYSCYHVIDYDPETGEVRSKETAQGYSDESDWARGQAWALYGYTVCYRYTKDAKYLKQAKNIADFIFKPGSLPEDLIPYWDYDAPDIPKAPRDASAAACSASALYELCQYVDEASKSKYLDLADQIMTSLGSSEYRANLGENGNFILMHSVGSIPHGVEIDVPLNYADYYFLEALSRKRGDEVK